MEHIRLVELYEHKSKLRTLKRVDPVLYDEIVSATEYLTQKKVFLRQRLWHLVNNILSPVLCKMCSSQVKWDDCAKDQKYRTYCSHKCLHNDPDQQTKKRATELKKYGKGRKSIVEKIKKTNLERYGTEFAIQTDEAKKKKEQTCLDRYGVINYSKHDSFLEKRNQTNIEKFGHIHPAQSKTIKIKTKQTTIDRYGSVKDRYKQSGEKVKQTIKKQRDHTERLINNDSLNKLNNKEWLIDKNKEYNLNQIADELNVHPSTVSRFLKQHNLVSVVHHSSSIEDSVALFLSKFRVTIQRNNRTTIKPKELDFLFPDHNIAIEINGIYWHSELGGNRDKRYHLNKTQLCNEKGIRLIHIWENEWVKQNDLVKSRIRNMLGLSDKIYARKCSIAEVPKQHRKDFFYSNHIQGDRLAPISLGLYYEDKLVAVMSFGKSRFNKNYQYELIRYACIQNTTVVGGASRLFKHFIKIYNPESVISYADLRWNTGNMYHHLGFNFSHNSKPNYFYFHPKDTNTLYSRQTFQKHKLKDRLELFDPDRSEWKNMRENGYDRIWDCGNAVYVWEN